MKDTSLFVEETITKVTIEGEANSISNFKELDRALARIEELSKGRRIRLTVEVIDEKESRSGPLQRP